MEFKGADEEMTAAQKLHWEGIRAAIGEGVMGAQTDEATTEPPETTTPEVADEEIDYADQSKYRNARRDFI